MIEMKQCVFRGTGRHQSPHLCTSTETRLYHGRTWLCDKHHRFGQMRTCAKTGGKSVPSYEELERLVQGLVNMACPHCGRTMCWRTAEDKTLAITLQHDISGRRLLLCFSCNRRHRWVGDDMYKIPPDAHRCRRCKEIKPRSEFLWRGRVEGRITRPCAPCVTAESRERRDADREKATAYQHDYWATHAAAFNAKRRADRVINKDKMNAQQRAFRKLHKDIANAKSRAYRALNAARINARQRIYIKAWRARKRTELDHKS